jgi:hypothetical protein
VLLFEGEGFWLQQWRKEGRKEGNGGEELSWRERERGGIFFATAV